MENEMINPYKIDHIVLNINESYQTDKQLVEMVRMNSIPYQPEKGKSTKGFKVSNLWLGKEYIEMVNIKSEDGGGWKSDWVNKYHKGHRGIICVFLDTDDLDSTIDSFQEDKITPAERLSYKFFFNLFKISAKWRNAYVPFFKHVPFQLGFQQVDTKEFHQRMYKKMKPNSEVNGMTGIESISFYGEFTDSEFEYLSSHFVTSFESPDHIVLRLKEDQSLHFIKDSHHHSRIVLKSDKRSSCSFKIEDVEITV